MVEEIPLEFRPGRAPASPPDSALVIQWAGTAAFTLKYMGATLLVDPFVTRPRILGMLLLKQRPNEALCREVFPSADHILVGHSHYDHLLDVPYIARHTGAVVHGSASTARVCAASGMNCSQVHEITPWQPIGCGAFKTVFVPGMHGKALRDRIPFPGEIPEKPNLPMHASSYRLGGMFGLLIDAGGFRIYHCGSGDLIDEEVAKIGKVDMLIAGLAGRQKTPDFLRRLVEPLRPDYLLPTHYDDFFRPLEQGFHFIRGLGLEDFYEERKQVCPDVKLIMPDFFESVAFDTEKKRPLIEQAPELRT